MSSREQLAQRRKELVVRGAVLRADLLAQSYLMRHTMTPSRIGSDVLDAAREHKLMLAGATIAAFVIKPRRIVGVLKSGFIALSALRGAVPLLHLFSKRS